VYAETNNGTDKLRLSDNSCLEVFPIGRWYGLLNEYCSTSESQKWMYTPSGEIQSVMYPGYCLHDGWPYPILYLKQCDGSSDQYWDISTLNVTDSPTLSPIISPAPSASPSFSPSSSALSPCNSSTPTLALSISVTTDSFPSEISWVVQRVPGDVIVESSEPFSSPETTYDKQLCLDPLVCYKFVINDSYGDGINSNGNFSVSVKNEVILDSTGNPPFTSLEVFFGDCVAPTPTPTIQPTIESWTNTTSKVASRRLPGQCIQVDPYVPSLGECSNSTGFIMEHVSQNEWIIRIPSFDYYGYGTSSCLFALPVSVPEVPSDWIFMARTYCQDEASQKWIYTSSGQIQSALYPSYCIHDGFWPYPLLFMKQCDGSDGEFWDLLPVNATNVTSTMDEEGRSSVRGASKTAFDVLFPESKESNDKEQWSWNELNM